MSLQLSLPAITGQLDASRAFHIFPDALQPWRPTILAYASTIASTTVGFPLDTVKTRMQTHKNFTSYGDCIKKTFAKEGIRGFFRGILAPLLSTSMSKSSSVGIFTQVKPYVYNSFFHGLELAKEHPFLSNIPVCLCSGIISGGIMSLFACPFEYTKVYAQISNLVEQNLIKDLPSHVKANHKIESPKSTSRIFSQILRHHGFMGLYTGFRFHFFRDALSLGIYYSIYETFKISISSVLENYDIPLKKSVSIMLSGGFAGMFAWLFVFPMDTAKSLVQKDLVANILRLEAGLAELPPKKRRITIGRGTYRGLGISVTRSFFVNMMFFSVFESLMAHVT